MKSSASGIHRGWKAWLADRQNRQPEGISGDVRLLQVTLQKQALTLYTLLELSQPRMEDRETSCKNTCAAPPDLELHNLGKKADSHFAFWTVPTESQSWAPCNPNKNSKLLLICRQVNGNSWFSDSSYHMSMETVHWDKQGWWKLQTNTRNLFLWLWVTCEDNSVCLGG